MCQWVTVMQCGFRKKPPGELHIQTKHSPSKVLALGIKFCVLGVTSNYCQNPCVGTVKVARSTWLRISIPLRESVNSLSQKDSLSQVWRIRSLLELSNTGLSPDGIVLRGTSWVVCKQFQDLPKRCVDHTRGLSMWGALILIHSLYFIWSPVLPHTLLKLF